MSEIMSSSHKLKNLLENSKYCIIQSNGQRVYGLRNKEFESVPPRGTELFVGKLPRTVYEDELVPLFSKCAPIYQLRLMVDFTGHNRGYCFVRYFTRNAADEALRTLNKYEIRRGCRIGVFKSIDNTRLFVGGIPQDKTELELKDELDYLMEGIKSVIMYHAPFDARRNRGYAFLEFENHRAAAIARRRVPPGSLILWGCKIKIDWAEPLPEPDPEIMSKVTTLYMRNLPPRLSFEAMRRYLNEVLDPRVISRMCKCSDYGFLHFTNRIAAAEALEVLRKIVLCGQLLEVSWARPKIYSKGLLQNYEPTHFCLSLPAKHRWVVQHKFRAPRYNNSNEYNDACSSGIKPFFAVDNKKRGPSNGFYYKPSTSRSNGAFFA